MSGTETILLLAAQMMARAHAPYSRFHVGAVVRDDQNRLHGGCNVENAAYPLGSCAEANAISRMVSEGGHQIREIWVMARGEQLVTPCGGCRQKIREFAAPDTPVHLCEPGRIVRTVTLGELLPMSFGPEVFHHD
ncbi:cytidine deaminase [Hahella sp. SMD15-11]|uniref:Cytidine deaminase n=1 Tax=Thermohahella caldifontis TaxID=3142973 RepID=A0AB39UZC9_9GAMM